MIFCHQLPLSHHSIFTIKLAEVSDQKDWISNIMADWLIYDSEFDIWNIYEKCKNQMHIPCWKRISNVMVPASTCSLYISICLSTLFLLHSLTQSLNVPPPFSLSLFSWKFPYLITLIIYPGTIFFFFILLYSLFYIPLHLLIFGIGFYVFIGINFILLINPFPFSKPNFPHFSSSWTNEIIFLTNHHSSLQLTSTYFCLVDTCFIL